VPPSARWRVIAAAARREKIGTVIDDAMRAIEKEKKLFYTTQIPVSLWFISRNKKQKGQTLFIDARKLGTMVSRRLREMTTDDIAKQNFILTPGRYVGIEAQADSSKHSLPASA